MAGEVFRRTEPVDRFVQTLNTTAKTLEETLGIDFGGSYPAVIELTKPNRREVFRQHPLRFIPDEIVIRKSDSIAHYDRTHDAYFVDPSLEAQDPDFALETEYHENLHGYQARMNPALFMASERQNRRFNRQHPETAMVNQCCFEGLAEYGTAIAFLYQFRFDRKEWMEKQLLGPSSAYNDAQAYTSPQFEKINAEIQRFSQGGRRFMPFSQSVFLLRCTSSIYKAGYFFSKFAVETLVRDGRMSFADAYATVTKHLPTTMHEMQRPIDYAHTLLATRIDTTDRINAQGM